MAVKGYQNIVTDGLIFSVDAYNIKSYVSGNTDTYNLVSNNCSGGTLLNGVGYGDKSWVFDGINDYINFTQLYLTNTINNFSIGLLFSPNTTITPGSLTQFSMLMEAQDQTLLKSDNYIYILTNGQLNFATFEPTNNLTSTQTTWNSDEWYHVFCTYESLTGTKKLFINGYLENSVSSINGNYFNTYTHFGLGGYNATPSFSPTNGFNGDMTNLMFYNRVLTPEEVLQNYNATKWRFQ